MMQQWQLVLGLLSIQEGVHNVFENLEAILKFYAPEGWQNKFPKVDPQILGETVQNWVTTETWRPDFVHPCCYTISVWSCRWDQRYLQYEPCEEPLSSMSECSETETHRTWQHSNTTPKNTRVEDLCPVEKRPVGHLSGSSVYQAAISRKYSKFQCEFVVSTIRQWRTQEFFSREGGSTNSVKDRGQRAGIWGR
jgi:hypothetical protein